MKIIYNIAQILAEITRTEKCFNRIKGSVCLLAVSKTRTVDEIKTAIAQQQRHFGENYCQEAIDKIKRIKNPELTWHFIGVIQSNKTTPIAEHFDWVHTVDRIKIARRLNEARTAANKPPLNICIQINVSKEQQKSGIDINRLDDFINELDAFEKIKLRGLMTLPAPADGFDAQRKPFSLLRQQLELARLNHPALDTLSMGTTQDMKAAIAEGATIVRIGTAIFGPRNAKM